MKCVYNWITITKYLVIKFQCWWSSYTTQASLHFKLFISFLSFALPTDSLSLERRWKTKHPFIGMALAVIFILKFYDFALTSLHQLEDRSYACNCYLAAWLLVSLFLTAHSAAEHLFVHFLMTWACVIGTVFHRFAADITNAVVDIKINACQKTGIRAYRVAIYFGDCVYIRAINNHTLQVNMGTTIYTYIYI